MKGESQAVAGVFGLVGVAAIALAFLNHWLLFGILVWLMMALAMAIGFGPEYRRPPILAAIIGIFLAYSALLLLLVSLDKPGEEPHLIWGFPAATAVLVFGIWPIGMVAGLLYGLVFSRSVLPEEKLRAFLSKFGSSEPER
jgi:hypothetical protein